MDEAKVETFIVDWNSEDAKGWLVGLTGRNTVLCPEHMSEEGYLIPANGKTAPPNGYVRQDSEYVVDRLVNELSGLELTPEHLGNLLERVAIEYGKRWDSLREERLQQAAVSLSKAVGISIADARAKVEAMG